MCVYACVCMHVYVYACVCVCMCMCMHVYVCACMCMLMCMHVYVCMHMCIGYLSRSHDLHQELKDHTARLPQTLDSVAAAAAADRGLAASVPLSPRGRVLSLQSTKTTLHHTEVVQHVRPSATAIFTDVAPNAPLSPRRERGAVYSPLSSPRGITTTPPTSTTTTPPPTTITKQKHNHKNNTNTNNPNARTHTHTLTA
jgi:hypothetical protein